MFIEWKKPIKNTDEKRFSSQHQISSEFVIKINFECNFLFLKAVWKHWTGFRLFNTFPIFQLLFLDKFFEKEPYRWG